MAGLAGVRVAVAPGSVAAIGIACFGVLRLGLGAINTLIFTLQPDTVDYGECKCGVRSEGSSYSLLNCRGKRSRHEP